MQVIKGMKRRPRKVLLYGTHGIGKTTWAGQAGNVIVLATEAGGDDAGADRSPVLRDLGSFNTWLSDLATQPHDYRWVAVDTLDWLEKLIFAAVCQSEGKQSIESIGYAKGYVYALVHWDFILKSLENLIAGRGMGVILLAHSRIIKIEEPDLDSYNKYEPDLDRRSCGLLQEWCDEVFFARYRVNTISKDEGFNRERTRVVGQAGDRMVYTCETPGAFAKRRIRMPNIIPLDFSVYLQAIKDAYGANGNPAPIPAPVEQKPAESPTEPAPPSGDIAGLINDGSSKHPTPEWANQ
jgi:hypothetical protein